MKEILRVVLKEQAKPGNLHEVERLIPQELLDVQEILVVSGIRRCGKSVLLQQIRKNNRSRTTSSISTMSGC